MWKYQGNLEIQLYQKRKGRKKRKKKRKVHQGNMDFESVGTQHLIINKEDF